MRDLRPRRINRMRTIQGSLAIDVPVESLVHKAQAAYYQAIQASTRQADGLIEMSIPTKPNSRLQQYRLTDKGRQSLQAPQNQQPTACDCHSGARRPSLADTMLS